MSNNPFIQDLKSQFTTKSALMKLILINVGMFVLLYVLGVVLYLFKIPDGRIYGVFWMAVPADLNQLITKPWTLITYMFLHEKVWHIAFNMLILYFSGRIFTQFMSEKKLVATYLLGGWSGAFLFILFFNVFPVFRGILPISIALGASASVMAILVAAATYVPNFLVRLMFIGNVKLKYIALLYIVADVISIPKSNPGGHIAHLGGALFGFLMVMQLKKGRDLTAGFARFLDRLKKLFSSQQKMKVVYSKTGKTRSDYEYNAQKKANQQKIDAILDKISKSGYDSLTKEEKAILFEQSKK
ncbi:MAG: rhomboid family intramembrane serine protease [Flavobacteriales bacterium]|nr:rhomboid family intramembrane serine protease [Flavobacteriales bacterium]